MTVTTELTRHRRRARCRCPSAGTRSSPSPGCRGRSSRSPCPRPRARAVLDERGIPTGEERERVVRRRPARRRAPPTPSTRPIDGDFVLRGRRARASLHDSDAGLRRRELRVYLRCSGPPRGSPLGAGGRSLRGLGADDRADQRAREPGRPAPPGARVAHSPRSFRRGTLSARSDRPPHERARHSGMLALMHAVERRTGSSWRSRRSRSGTHHRARGGLRLRSPCVVGHLAAVRGWRRRTCSARTPRTTRTTTPPSWPRPTRPRTQPPSRPQTAFSRSASISSASPRSSRRLSATYFDKALTAGQGPGVGLQRRGRLEGLPRTR